MVLVIDNYDSFTYNLVQLVGELGAQPIVRRNDEVTLGEIASLRPSHLIISPGPGAPEDAGISNEVIRHFHRTTPILGVCLGHQCIGHVFGARVVRARRPVHGKTSLIHHDGRHLFRGLPSAFWGTRYHSLILQEPFLHELEISALTSDGEVMGVRHKRYPIEGVQFHPESILTEHGKAILKNFLEISKYDARAGGQIDD